MNRLKDPQKLFLAALTVHSLSLVDIWWPKSIAVSDTISDTPLTVTPLVEILQFLPLNNPLNLILNSLAYFSHTSIRIFNPERVGASRLRSSAKASAPIMNYQAKLGSNLSYASTLKLTRIYTITDNWTGTYTSIDIDTYTDTDTGTYTGTYTGIYTSTYTDTYTAIYTATYYAYTLALTLTLTQAHTLWHTY